MRILATALLTVLLVGGLAAQNTDGKGMIGFRGGANMYFSEYQKYVPGVGGDVVIRYAFTRVFSLGLMGGYEALKADYDGKESVPFKGYVRLDGIPLSLVGWFNLSPGSRVTPLLYFGVGGMAYRRTAWTKAQIGPEKNNATIHIPVGLELDFFLGKNVSFTLDLGARVMDEWTDFARVDKTMPDAYFTGKAGLDFYIGSSGSDDSDGDGLTNSEEERLETNPNQPDTDNDGLRDGDEVRKYATDPKAADTDADGLSDGEEVMQTKTDPRKADTDGDGLKDADEVKKYKTDPLRADTDGDGLTDAEEIMIYNTDPLKGDTDGDTLTDGDEVKKYKTDPNHADTDGGSVNDNFEIGRGSNPLDAADDVPKVEKVEKVVKVGEAMVLEGITFRTGSAEILPESAGTLETALKTLKAYPNIVVEVRGHTDNVGSRETNARLSQRRAESVRNWLVNRGVEPARLTAMGMGPDYPVALNTTAEGRAKNRRIEFVRLK
jgi:outer membrane protein OmpA-like peptidoglycan-associated protein